MAHNLNQRSDGSYAMMGLRLPAWHGLGQIIDKPVTDIEAERLAGMDWEVELVPLCRSDMVGVPTHCATVRSDTRDTLGVVGASFTPAQNRDLFKWVRGLESIGEVIIETAGAIGQGELVWVQCRCDGLKYDINGDIHRSYLSLINGHGGQHKLTVTGTDTREVCENTTNLILSDKRHGTIATGWDLRHRSGIHDQLEVIQKLYHEVAKAHKVTKELLEMLANKPLTDEAIKRMFVEPFIPKAKVAELEAADVEALDQDDMTADEKAEADESIRAKLMREEREKRLNEILAGPTCQTANAGSMYSVLQAVTEFAQHEVMVRPKNDGERSLAEARFKSNLDGRAFEIKGRAIKLALELAGV
jgi:phage/plasmid-like protein (TIGR03299 family)